MSYVKGLKCRECERRYPKEALYVCEYCFGPLEVEYDYERLLREAPRSKIERGPKSLWRYRDFLPIEGEPVSGLSSGFTPLLRAENLGRELGVRELYIKDDSVCHPTLSFKDRVVCVALTKAREFGFDTTACASTGNLANSVSAQSALANFKRFIFIPADLELGKVVASLVYQPTVVAVEGNYDEVNRLCTEIASKYRWAFVNINIRPYYAEGSKTLGFEIAEQLGWTTPKHVVVPIAGGSLITKIHKSFKEFEKMGYVDRVETKIHGAQAEGCCPVITALREKSDIIKPVKPKTIAKSLAIGNPADGFYAARTIRESGGTGEAATDDEIVEAMKLLAATEGVFTETAGGVTVAVARKLIRKGVLPKDEPVVLCITGNGLKTQEALEKRIGTPVVIKPSLESFESAFREKGVRLIKGDAPVVR